MAASAWRVYNEAKKYLLTGDIDLNTSLMRMKLLKGTKAAAVSDYTRSTFASLTHETTNITTPLRTLTNIAVTAGASGSVSDFDLHFVLSDEANELLDHLAHFVYASCG